MKNKKRQRKCESYTCFANIEGVCDALEPAEDGYGASDGHGGVTRCPFYKKKDDVDKDRIDALERVVNKERFDLIRKYRPTLEQVGVLDAVKAADSFFDAHRADIEELQELAFIEQEIRNGRICTNVPGISGESDEWDKTDEWDEPDGEDANGGIDDS